MKNLLSQKDHNRRYYLHRKVKLLYETNSYKREVNVPHKDIEIARENEAVMELCGKYGYNIQSSIF